MIALVLIVIGLLLRDKIESDIVTYFLSNNETIK